MTETIICKICGLPYTFEIKIMPHGYRYPQSHPGKCRKIANREYQRKYRRGISNPDRSHAPTHPMAIALSPNRLKPDMRGLPKPDTKEVISGGFPVHKIPCKYVELQTRWVMPRGRIY